MKLSAAWLAIALAGIAGGGAAATEDYPSKAVRIITANSVGGTSDIFVRALAPAAHRQVLRHYRISARLSARLVSCRMIRLARKSANRIEMPRNSGCC